MLIEIHTHSGHHLQAEVEQYNAVELNDQINNHELNTIVIGNRIFSRIDIKYVSPVEEPAPAEPDPIAVEIEAGT